MLLSGRNYIGSVQLRCNSLYTKGRASRGRTGHDVKCEVCGDYESLGHILQTCARTWNVRNQRHDFIVSKAVVKFRELGYEVLVEPHIATTAGIRIPDIFAMVPGHSAVVVDVTVVSDGADLSRVHTLKTQYHGQRSAPGHVKKLAVTDAALLSQVLR